jgi:short-subunit dehydrogenase
MHFRDKVVIITGASSGIGKALAETLKVHGAKLALCARNVAKLEQEYAGWDKENLLLFGADVSREADCQAFVAAVAARWGRVDALINNAGVSMRALFEDADLAVLRELMDINFWGTVYMSKLVLPLVMESRGIIAGVSSIAGYRGLPARTGYSASKFAMQGFMEALRTEILHTGVHVMWVCPGFTASNIRNTARSADGSAQKESPRDEGKMMSAEACAAIIVRSMEQRRRTVVMTRQGKLAVWMNKLLPGFVDKQVYKLFLKEPDSPLLRYERKS